MEEKERYNIQDDFNWFDENFAKLCYEYGNSFIVIHNKHVHCKHSAFRKTVQEADAAFGRGNYLIQHCEMVACYDEPPHTICCPSFSWFYGDEYRIPYKKPHFKLYKTIDE